MAENPAQYLARLKTKFNDARAGISGIAHMPYPADPLVEPELVGLSYYQVGVLRQAELMGIGSLDALEFFSDRLIGKPAQVNLNVNTTESYSDFLKRIAVAEGEIIDVESENELGL
jgi:hypothetical protein